jgi:hypothetical protein
MHMICRIWITRQSENINSPKNNLNSQLDSCTRHHKDVLGFWSTQTKRGIKSITTMEMVLMLMVVMETVLLTSRRLWWRRRCAWRWSGQRSPFELSSVGTLRSFRTLICHVAPPSSARKKSPKIFLVGFWSQRRWWRWNQRHPRLDAPACRVLGVLLYLVGFV